jgi:succinate dehydrogenase / fumarate reductase flavoprotein subunit
VLPTVHYNMGGIPTNYHGEVLTKKDGDPDAVVPGPDGGRRGRLRLGARRQPARLQFADRPRGVRPRRGAALRRNLKPGKQPELPAKVPPTRRWPGSTSFRNAKGGTPTAKLRLEMQHVMQNNCAVFRTGECCTKARS